MYETAGIDLGTSFSSINVAEPGHGSFICIKVAHINTGTTLFSSVLSYLDDGSEKFAFEAENNLKYSPKNFIKRAKRYFVEKVELDEKDNIHLINERTVFKIGNEDIVVEEAINRLLTNLFAILLQNYPKAKNVVITAPVNYPEEYKSLLSEISRINGINLLKVINEPYAAAKAYFNSRNQEINGTIMVVDFGAGTLDIALLRILNSKVIDKYFDGDPKLGGSDIDSIFYQYIKDRLENRGYFIDSDKKQSIIKRKCIECKETLSYLNSVELGFSKMDDDDFIEISREEFNDLIRDLIEKCISKMKQMVEEFKYNPQSIILTGGSTMITLLRERIFGEFGIMPDFSFDPEFMVSKGAAIYAYHLYEKKKHMFFDNNLKVSKNIVMSRHKKHRKIKKSRKIIKSFDHSSF